MNTRPLSPRQQQLLSEYLDDRLSARQKAEVEALLRDNPEAATTLENLRQLRLLLRNLPARRLPHNFTLTRQMAQQQKRPPVLSWLRLSSILAMLLTVFLVTLDLLPIGATAPRTAETEKAIEMYANAASAPTPPIIYWNGNPGSPAADAQAIGMGGGAEAGPLNKFNSTPQPVDSRQPIVTQPVIIEQPIQSTPTAITAENNSAARSADAQPILGLRPEEAGQVLDTQPNPTQLTGNESTPPATTPLRWAQISLATLTVLLGLLTLWGYKRWQRGK